ncbi:hypothetical protein EI94DRAFT_1708472 [Lactarius quietus]|nr:hypothetical protein EI94DRAFT_1710284 [Lactarius quietus]KAF8257925.1 hypothetical protein EI94DRAFT_1708472 [Lactarius quietus]
MASATATAQQLTLNSLQRLQRTVTRDDLDTDLKFCDGDNHDYSNHEYGLKMSTQRTTTATATTMVHGNDHNNPNSDDDRDDHNDHNDHGDVPHDYDGGDSNDRQHLHLPFRIHQTLWTLLSYPGGISYPPYLPYPIPVPAQNPYPPTWVGVLGGRGKGSNFLPGGYPCQSLFGGELDDHNQYLPGT